MPKLTIEELKKMRESAKKKIYLRDGSFRGKVIVHMGTCGIAAGAREIMSAFLDELSKSGVTDIMITTSGCAGLCSSSCVCCFIKVHQQNQSGSVDVSILIRCIISVSICCVYLSLLRNFCIP